MTESTGENHHDRFANTTTKRCDCQQCRMADEAFGFDGLMPRESDFDANDEEDLRYTRESRCMCAASDYERSKIDDAHSLNGDWALTDEDEFGAEGDFLTDEEDLDADEEEELAELDESENDEEDRRPWFSDFDEDEQDIEAFLSDEDEFAAEDDDDADEDDLALEDDEDEFDLAVSYRDEADDETDFDDIDIEELMADSSFDLPELETEYDNFEVRHVRPGCPGVRRISIRKNRDGKEPFGDDRITELCNASLLALRQASRAWKIIQSVWSVRGVRRKRRRWHGNPELVRWFGSRILTRRQMRVTRRRIRRILRALKRGVWFVVVQHQKGKLSWSCEGAVAYAYGSSRIFLCPSFVEQNVNEQARTSIHEQVHRMGWGHPILPGQGRISRHGPGDREKALELARVKPIRARRSPVNFAWFMSSIYYKT